MSYVFIFSHSTGFAVGLLFLFPTFMVALVLLCSGQSPEYNPQPPVAVHYRMRDFKYSTELTHEENSAEQAKLLPEGSQKEAEDTEVGLQEGRVAPERVPKTESYGAI